MTILSTFARTASVAVQITLLCFIYSQMAAQGSPAIVVQPSDQTIAQGGAVTFAVGAEAAVSSLPDTSSGNLRLWLKSDAGVITNGAGFVTLWQDQSGNGNHAYQSNAINCPVRYNSAVPVSYRPAILFDGIQDAAQGDYLQGLGDLGIPDGYTSFLVYSRTEAGLGERVPALIGVPGNRSSTREYYIADNKLGFSAWANDYKSQIVSVPNSFRIWTDRMDTNRSKVEIFDYDGTTVSSFVATATLSISTPGAGYYIGGLGPETRNFKGFIGELIYFKGTLSEVDRYVVESYLKQKFLLAPSSSPLPVSYQWLFNGTAIPEATNYWIKVNNVQPDNAGFYSVIVSNAVGTVSSSNAALIVRAIPTITQQPESQTVWLTSNATFNVQASGDGLSFQWQKVGNNIPGATNNSLTITNVQIPDAGQYRVVISNIVGVATSSWATLTITGTPPSIVTQPIAQSVYPGGAASFHAVASGALPLSYQWYFNVTNRINGATGSELSVSNAQLGQAGSYSVRVTNLFGSVTSECAELAVLMPRIDSFSPSSGPAGCSLVLNGANFSSITSNNVVYLGGIRAPIISATTTQLSVVVPTNAVQGYITATVNGFSTISYSPFNVTYAGRILDNTSFRSPVALPTGAYPVGVQLVDFDRDGKADLLVVNSGEPTVSVYRNVSGGGVISTSTFAPRVSFTVKSSPRECAVSDVDGDGALDVVVSYDTGASISVFRNVSIPGQFTSDSFAIRLDLPSGNAPMQVELADLNGDGKKDLVTANASDDTFSVIRNACSVGLITANTFASKVSFGTGSRPSKLAIADLDGDRRLDVVVGNENTSTISVFLNTTPVGSSNFSFAPRVDFSTPTKPFGGISIGDLDGDAKADIVVGSYTGGAVSVYKNRSSIGSINSSSFIPRFDLATGGSTLAVMVADVTGDGRSDLLSASQYANAVAVFRNVGTNGILVSGSFAPRLDYTVTPANDPCSLAIGDIDADGKPDIVAADFYSGKVSIFENINVPGPEIYIQPEDRTVPVGASVNLVVGTDGAQPFTYQWRRDSLPISGATGSSLILTNVQVQNSGAYSVVVSNLFGSVSSRTATVVVSIPPYISRQPRSQSVGSGASAFFEVMAEGAAPLTYQWLFNGTQVAGATGASLVVSNVQLSDSGSYSVIVSNRVGVAVSSNALLTIQSTVTIKEQPEDKTALAGANVTFAVGVQPTLPSVASGTLQLWLKADAGVITNQAGYVQEWRDQSGWQNDAVQTNSAQQPMLARVAVLNGWPSIRFDGIRNSSTGDYLRSTNNLNLSNAYTSFLVYSRTDSSVGERVPVLIGSPGSYNSTREYYIPDGRLGFSAWGNDYVTSFIIPTNTYRIWTDRMNTNRSFIEMFDSAIGSSNYFSSAIGGIAAPSSGYYVGGLGDSARGFQGDITELVYYRGSLTEADRLAVQSYLEQKYYGTTCDPDFQWQYNGVDIVGATNSSLTLTNVQADAAGTYRVIVSNAAGSIASSNAVLTVNVPPAITQQPQSCTVLAGIDVHLSVSASGTAPLSYQWQFNQVNISGATDATLTLPGVRPADAGSYRVMVSSPYGVITSSNAVLDVIVSTVRVANASGVAGTVVTVPIQLEAVGSENAVGLTLSFDPALLSYTGVALGGGASGGIFVANTNQLSSGRLTLAVALPSGTVFAAGIQEILKVNFRPTILTNNYVANIGFAELPSISDLQALSMYAACVPGTLTVNRPDYEADVTPRFNTDHVVTITDWVQVGRFVAHLDMPNSTEFQRADCAPKSTLGNAILSVTDWVQAGRYAAGLDLPTIVGGPTKAISVAAGLLGGVGKSSLTRVIEIAPVVNGGGTTSVCVQLIASGDENAIGFTLVFDPAVLRYSGAALGSSVSGAFLNLNTNDLPVGRLGVVAMLPTGSTFSPGLQEIANVTFAPITYLDKATVLNFSDSPVVCELSDVEANKLSADFASKSLTVAGKPKPRLALSSASQGFELNWPVGAEGFELQTSTDLVIWTPASLVLTTNGTSVTATLPAGQGTRFYRLKQ